MELYPEDSELISGYHSKGVRGLDQDDVAGPHYRSARVR